ncbi:MAG: hypothetical protein ACXWQE_14230, partial [Bdellovibrionales bacterium]
RVLGWMTGGLLSLVLSSSAWALDLDRSIAQQNQDATQIVKTLGRGKKVNSHTTRRTKKKVYVVLFKAHPRKKA